jgi:hypothetical protein
MGSGGSHIVVAAQGLLLSLVRGQSTRRVDNENSNLDHGCRGRVFPGAGLMLMVTVTLTASASSLKPTAICRLHPEAGVGDLALHRLGCDGAAAPWTDSVLLQLPSSHR